jgi:hypothetical protein
MILDGKKVFAALDEYEADVKEKHIRAVLEISDKEERDRKTTIAAVEIRTVREIRDRLGIPEIKA